MREARVFGTGSNRTPRCPIAFLPPWRSSSSPPVAAVKPHSAGGPRPPQASGALVIGRVVEFSGTPVGGVHIRIGTQTTTTDPRGQFVLGNVDTPYVLVASSVEEHLAVIYQGLTREDPTILWRGSGAAVDRAGAVQGAIRGGSQTSTAGVFTILGWASPEAKIQSFTFNGRYALPLRWSGAQATTGSVHVLQTDTDTQGLPRGFLGYGVHTGVTVGDGATVSSIDVPLASVTASSVRGTQALPPGYAFLERVVSAEFDDGTLFSLGADDSPGSAFSHVVPSGIEALIRIHATARGEGTTVTHQQSGIAAGAVDLAVTLPPGAPIHAPADGATAVDGQTHFSWGTFPGGIYTLQFSTPGPGPTVYLVTQDTETFLPQLAELPVPSATGYRWSVRALAPFGLVDEAAGPHLLVPAGRTLLESLAESRTFVTR